MFGTIFNASDVTNSAAITQTFVRLNQKIIKGLNIYIVIVMVVNVCFDIIRIILCIDTMEDGGVDRNAIDCRQSQLGQMAEFSCLLTFFYF